MTDAPPAPATRDTQADAALRNAGWVTAQRGFQFIVGILFALLVPRFMGPQTFGQYALVTSISLWFALLTGLGAVSMMTRSVPPLLLRGDTAGLRTLMSGLLGLRLGTGLAAAAGYLTLTVFWLHEVDAVALLCIAGAIVSRTTANICFAFFLGLNQAARWGLGEVLRRWLTLPLVLAGFAVGGLRGACAGFLAAHVVVLAIGVWMSRAHLRWSALWPDLRFLLPTLRTGAYFAGGNLVLSLSQRTGEALVQLFTGSFTEVGYFGVAYGAYTAAAQALWYLSVAFAPLLVTWKERGDVAAIGEWLERVLTWMTVAVTTGLIVVLLIGGEAVPLLIGDAYRPAARNLVPLSVAMIAVAVSSVGRLQSLVADRPGSAAAAAAIELVTFWAVGPLLAARLGSFGACLAVLAGSTLNAGYLAWKMQRSLPYARRPAIKVLALALPALALALVRASWPWELLALAAGLAAFSALLLGARVVTVAEIAGFRRRFAAGRILRTTASGQAAPVSPESPSM